MATNKLNKTCSVNLIIISARDIGSGILMSQNSEIEKAYRRLVEKTVEAIRNADSRQH